MSQSQININNNLGINNYKFTQLISSFKELSCRKLFVITCLQISTKYIVKYVNKVYYDKKSDCSLFLITKEFLKTRHHLISPHHP